MATIAIDINNRKDLSVIMGLVIKLGLKYQVAENMFLVYTDEIKASAVTGCSGYGSGIVQLMKPDENRSRIADQLID